MRKSLACACFLGAIAVASGARADDPASLSEAAIARGVELRKEGKDIEALAEFKRAYEIAPSPRARAQIGLAELALGKWVDCEAHLQEALRAKDDPWIAKHTEPLEKSLAIAQPHLAWLQVDVNVPGAELFVNGERVGSLPMTSAARVVAGSVVVDVRAPGYVEVKRPMEVVAGARMRESITLVPVQTETDVVRVPPHVDAREPSRGNATLRALGWTALGVGVVGLAVGSYFGVRTFSDKSDRDAHCVAAGCDSVGLAFDHDARRDATLSTVAFTAGGVGLAAGAILLWRGIVGGSTAAPSAKVQIAPRVSTRGAMLGVEGAF